MNKSDFERVRVSLGEFECFWVLTGEEECL